MNCKKNQKGLTLIELLAVIAIIAILFVLLIPQISSSINKARETGIKTDFRSYLIAFDSFLNERGNEKIKLVNFNKYLDDEISFTGFYSKKTNPFGEKYVANPISFNSILIETQNEDKTYSILISKEKGSLEYELFGFGDSSEEKVLFTNGDFEYIKKGNENAIIYSYLGSGGSVSIPSTIDNLKVTEIASYSFSNFEQLGRNKGGEITNLNISNGVKIIHEGAFRVQKIENLTLPNSLEYIFYLGFRSNQIKELTLPPNLKSIEPESFTINPMINYKIQGNPIIGGNAFPPGAIKLN